MTLCKHRPLAASVLPPILIWIVLFGASRWEQPSTYIMIYNHVHLINGKWMNQSFSKRPMTAFPRFRLLSNSLQIFGQNGKICRFLDKMAKFANFSKRAPRKVLKILKTNSSDWKTLEEKGSSIIFSWILNGSVWKNVKPINEVFYVKQSLITLFNVRWKGSNT